MGAKIWIGSSDDWDTLPTKGLGVIVDPMVFRTADLFFRDWRANQPDMQGNPRDVWSALSANVDALASFVDALILNERLPMFDYQDTFGMGFDMGHHLLQDRFNRDDEILVSVAVSSDARAPIRDKAIDLLAHQDPAPPDVAMDIVAHLEAYEYNWSPTLPQLPSAIADPRRRSVFDSFRFGGLLFTGYAQRVSGEHVLQPARARLYLKNALHRDPWTDQALTGVMAPLMEVARDAPSEVLRTVELPRLPTFLPFLLQGSDDTPMTPIQLLHRVLDLRNQPEVVEYRRWWARLRDDLDQGVVTTSTETDLREIAAQLRGRLGLDPEHDAALGGACAVIHPNGHGNEIARRTGLYLPGVAGQGHRKVLMDLVLADRATKALDRRLLRVWNAGLA